MKVRHAFITSGVALTIVLALPVGAASAAPGSGGCQAFGANVAFLATTRGAAFGALASSVASSEPRAFPTIVVHPEQDAFCP